MKVKFLGLLILSSIFSYAQDQGSPGAVDPAASFTPSPAPKIDSNSWKKAFKLGLNMNQASFSDNWKGGGVSSIAYMAFFNGTVDYAFERLSFNNLIDLQFGSVNNKNSGFFKNVDKIYFDSKVGYAIAKHWNIYAAVNFQTQFYEGYTIKSNKNGDTSLYISNFMSPGYLTESVGFEYKPVTWFFARFGTGTLRQTFVTARNIDFSETKNYGVDSGKSVRNEVAFMLQMGLDKDLSKNINFKARYMGFANYMLPKQVKDNTNITFFDYIDHRFDATLTAKITKYISTNVNATLLYDYDQDSNVQIAQSLGLGVLITF
ncbi:MAG: DUF3078 domain-containing protein [Opitutaceae bacterium]|nr:DUF3078 domain-containing protein [Cytophagales bacterium]